MKKTTAGERSSRPRRAESPERTERRAQRRVELLQAAMQVIRRDGPHASMDEFAAEAGVTKPILYRHFGDRAGLCDAITAYALEHLGAGLEHALTTLDAPPRQVIANTIDSYLVFIEHEPELYRFLTQRVLNESPDSKRATDDFLGQVSREVAVLFGEALRAVGADSGPAEAWAHGIVGMVFAAGGWWLERRTMPRARLSAYLTQLVCDGLPGIDDIGSTLGELIASPGAPTGASGVASGRPDTAPPGAGVVSLSTRARRNPA